MIINLFKWVQIGPNKSKKVKICQNWIQKVQTGQFRGPNRSEQVNMRQKLSKMVQNDLKLSKRIKNGPNWRKNDPKITQNSQNDLKLFYIV